MTTTTSSSSSQSSSQSSSSTAMNRASDGPWYMRHSFTNGPSSDNDTHREISGRRLSKKEQLHDADEEVMRIISYQGEGDASGQAVVPTLAPLAKGSHNNSNNNSGSSGSMGSSSSTGGDNSSSSGSSGSMSHKKPAPPPSKTAAPPVPPPSSAKPTAEASSGSGSSETQSPSPDHSLSFEERVEQHLDAMDFDQFVPEYTIGEGTAVEMTPEFLDQFFLAADQGNAELLFAMVADPEFQRERWTTYCRDLKVQLREEERERLEEEERKRIAEEKGERHFKKPVYIKRAKKPWEPESIDDTSVIPTKSGLDLNARDPAEFDSTALHKSVRKMRMDCVTLLTRCEHCDVNLANGFGETPLHFSVKNGHVQSTYVLLKRGARIDVRDKAYDSPMSLGIKLARDGCCKLLVEFGADVSELYDRNLVRVRKMNLENDEDGANMEGIQFDSFGFPADKSRNMQDSSSAEAEQWRNMLKNMIKKGRIDKSLKKKIRKGVPNRIRGALWKTILPIEDLKRQNSGVYNKLLQGPSIHSKQIDLDINRTFREHRDFRERYGEYQIKLFNVLKAYSLRNPDVGYTQGMSSLTAFFLMYLPQEEDVFWMLDHVLGDPMYDLKSIFLPGFPRLYECFFVHEQILAKTLPALSNHFESQGIMTSMYATKWYMLLMMDILPFSTVARLWDIFLFEGNKVVFNVILSVFKLIESQLLGMDFEQIMTFLAGLDRVDINGDRLIMLATEKKVKHKYIKEYIKQFQKENPPQQQQSSSETEAGKKAKGKK